MQTCRLGSAAGWAQIGAGRRRLPAAPCSVLCALRRLIGAQDQRASLLAAPARRRRSSWGPSMALGAQVCAAEWGPFVRQLEEAVNGANCH